jgi:hypothetical protein
LGNRSVIHCCCFLLETFTKNPRVEKHFLVASKMADNPGEPEVPNVNNDSNENDNDNNGHMSSKSSDISIEEIGAEDESANVEKDENAEILVPEVEELEEIEPTREILGIY